VVRDGIVVHEGELASLRRFKDDVREVAQGYECGIGIEKYSDIKVGDVIEAFIMEQIEV
jgi:translation initiation factor IF-2